MLLVRFADLMEACPYSDWYLIHLTDTFHKVVPFGNIFEIRDEIEHLFTWAVDADFVFKTNHMFILGMGFLHSADARYVRMHLLSSKYDP